MMATAREVALHVLTDVLVNQAYSNHALNEQFKKEELSAQDKGFVTEIVYGTLQHQRLLTYYMEPHINGRLKGWVRILIQLTIYQILFLNHVPAHAAISEAVGIAKKRGGQFNANLVNGFCREFIRQEKRSLEDIKNPLERLAIETSHPDWLIKLWAKQFGEEQTRQMAFANNERVAVKVRVNTLKTTKENLQAQLLQEGIKTTTNTLVEEALRIEGKNVAATQSFADGLCYVQDEASMLVADALDPKPHAKVLDVCAAPGGKTTHLAQVMGNCGEIFAHDIYEHKLKLINENAARLGITSIKASCQDATTLKSAYEPQSFDYILVDAPCTGLGIMRRHPEAKLTKKPEDLDAIIQIQQTILEQVADLLKVGGTLVYSTCTVNRKENDKMVEQFIKKYPDYQLDQTLANRLPAVLKDKASSGMLQLLPGEFDTDGFFIAALVRQ